MIMHLSLFKQKARIDDPMKKKRIGKKAQFFMPLFAVVTLIIFTTLYLDLIAKTDQFSKDGDKIGEKQAAVLNAAALGERAKYYVDIAVTYAYDTALLEAAKSSYISSNDCTMYRGAAVFYGTNDCMQYGEELQQKIQEKLTEEFNQALIPYLEAYVEVDIPQENYLLLFEGGNVKGIAQEPIEIPIFSTTSSQPAEKTITKTAALGTTTAALGTTLFTQWPTAYEERRINSCFGNRGGDVVSGKTKGSTYHPGVDIRSPRGINVLAVASGTVVSTSAARWGRIVIDHGNNIYTEYLHLDRISVTLGQHVSAAEILGTSGGRGKHSATEYAAHLHFGVIDKNIEPTLKDDHNDKAVVSSFGETGFVNPLCYFDSETLSYDYENNPGCRSQGGPLKFCDLYRQEPKVTEVIGEETTTYKATTETQAMFEQIDKNYGSIIEQAISTTSVSKSLVIGLIAQESRGNPNAVSSTGCKGLMQFCASTAYAYGLCDNKKCSGTDYREDPTKIINAGVKLINDNQNTYKKYTDKIAFGLAAYNGGAAVITDAIAATGKTDPSWSEVSFAITADIIEKYYSKEIWPTTESRNKRAKQIIEYPNNVLSYMHAYETQEGEQQ